MKKKMLIFHNYRTPYRDVLFNLLAQQFNLTIIYLQKPDDDDRKWKDASKTQYQTFQMQRIVFKKLVLNSLFLPEQIRHAEFDLVVFIDNMPNLLMMMLYSRIYFRKTHRVLWTEDGNMGCKDTLLKKIFQKTLRLLVLKNMDELWFFSEKTMVYWQKNYPQKTYKRLLQSPHSCSDFSSIPQKHNFIPKKTFGYLGYFSERKGLLDLVKAFTTLRLNEKSAQLKIAGDGQLKETLIKIKNESIQLLGYITEQAKADFFSTIDFIVLPSYQDPWGLVINEAMAYGIIPIVSDETGAKEMAEGVGYIFTSGSIDSLTKGLQWALSLNEKDIKDLSMKARKLAEEYTNDKNLTLISENIIAVP